MFEKFLSGEWENFRQRYNGTYGFFRNETGSRILSRIDDISRETCSFVDARGVAYHLNADSIKDIGFEFIPPRSGYTNTQAGAMLSQRVASRQFQRGVSGKNMLFYQLSERGLRIRAVDFKSLTEAYESHINTKDAYTYFETGKVPSVSISPSLAMGAGQAYVLDQVVGEYSIVDHTMVIKLRENMPFITEFTDAFKAISRPLKIT